jgi:hypothetical protein
LLARRRTDSVIELDHTAHAPEVGGSRASRHKEATSMKHSWVSALIVLSACLSGCTSGGDRDTGAGGGTVPPETGADSGTIPPPDGTYPCLADGDGKTTAVFINRCASPLEVRGSDIEGATIPVGAFVCRDLGTAEEPLSAKRYWGFLGEDPGAEHHTLAEFTFNTDFNDFDWYNISHVDAHNLTMQIAPLERASCETLTCADPSLLEDCPEVGRWMGDGGDLIACVSPDRNDGESEVARFFESCDDAYAWSGDDQHGEDPSPVRACAGEDWAIVFCP